MFFTHTGARAFATAHEFNQTAPITLYARWAPIAHTLTFDHQGGTSTLESRMHISGTLMDHVPVPTHSAGHTFAGYFTEPNGTGVQMFASNGMPLIDRPAFRSNTTLYAHWVRNVIQLTFDGAGGTFGGGTPTPTMTRSHDNRTATPSATVPTHANSELTFMGFFTAPNGHGRQIFASNGASMEGRSVFEDDTTLYAHWMDLTIAPSATMVTVHGMNAGMQLDFFARHGLPNATPATQIVFTPGNLTQLNLFSAAYMNLYASPGLVFRGWFASPDHTVGLPLSHADMLALPPDTLIHAVFA